MSFTLGDITELNPKMADINDVQLSWYPDDKRNAQLCEFYIWSNHSVGAAQPSIELLAKVREAFLMTGKPRRFIFRATYGHGKTHLALALANFFGRSADAPEVQSILGQLRASSPAKANGFAAFKEERAPYLVVRLFGENVSNLPQAVVTALETALGENPASADYKLNFWFDKALESFEKFSAEQIERANEFLAKHKLDFATLCQRLRERDGQSFEISTHLIEEIIGFAPNFGRAVELDQLIVKVTADLCGEDKPFSGLLILFDEFSAFTRSYAQDYVLKRGTPLQSLLDGVGNCGHLAAIVALSQYDPNSDLQAIFQRLGASADDRQNIEKELNRLPEPNRYQLYSSLELVLSNLLRQDDSNWDALTADGKVWEQIEDATNDTMRLYEAHYSEQMDWGDERVQTILTKGCFPFHPLTIAILCKSNLRGDESGARTVMGYLTEAFREQATAPALQNGILNWISPVSLVEKFERAIVFDDILWGQYSQTLRHARAEAPDSQKSVLRAMLLHEVVGLKVSRAKGSYEENIAVLSGLSGAQTDRALGELFAAGYLKRDDTRNVYAFWPMGEDGSKVEAPLQQEVTAMLGDAARLEAALEKAVGKWGWGAQEVAGAPGHPQDWGAEMWILPRALFGAEKLRELARSYRIEKLAIGEAPRGIVVSLVATTNEDLTNRKDLIWLDPELYECKSHVVVVNDDGAFATNASDVAAARGGVEKFAHGGIFPEEVVVPWLVFGRDVAPIRLESVLTGKGRAGREGRATLRLSNSSARALFLESIELSYDGQKGAEIALDSLVLESYSNREIEVIIPIWPHAKPARAAKATLMARLPGGRLVENEARVELQTEELQTRDNVLDDLI